MALIRKYNNEWLPSIFDDFLDNNWMPRTGRTAPAINVIEAEKEYKVEVAAPGMTKDDFQIHVDADQNLVISMEKKQESQEGGDNKRYLRREFSFAKFQQTLILPDDVDKDQIGARVADGVLTITLPKLAPEKQEPVKRNICIE